jgi:hypothetical protein
VAKKSRTPSPPKRPVQAPKKRSQPRDPKRTRLILGILGGVIVVGGIAGALAFTLGRGGDAEAGGVCEIQRFPSQGQNHVAKLPKDFEPNSYPRTSGPHSQQTLVYGDYDDPVAELNLVHNLEHGAVGTQYGSDVPEEVVDRLVAWYRTDPRGLILAPLPDNEKAADLQDKIVLSAWVAELEDEDDPNSDIVKQEGVLGICSTFDEGDFNDFLDDFRAKGPERFELDQLQPGSA